MSKNTIGRLYTENAIIRLYELVWLCVSSLVPRRYTRRIIRLEELSLVVRLSRRISKDSSSRRIKRLVPVFILETKTRRTLNV